MSPASIEWFFGIWTSLALLFSLCNLGIIVRDWYQLRTRVRAGQAFLLKDDVRRECIRVALVLMMVCIAVAAIVTPNRPGPTPRTWLQLVVLLSLLLMPVCVTADSVLDILARQRLRKFYGQKK